VKGRSDSNNCIVDGIILCMKVTDVEYEGINFMYAKAASREYQCHPDSMQPKRCLCNGADVHHSPREVGAF
jgi:hypothetical protein